MGGWGKEKTMSNKVTFIARCHSFSDELLSSPSISVARLDFSKLSSHCKDTGSCELKAFFSWYIIAK